MAIAEEPYVVAKRLDGAAQPLVNDALCGMHLESGSTGAMFRTWVKRWDSVLKNSFKIFNDLDSSDFQHF